LANAGSGGGGGGYAHGIFAVVPGTSIIITVGVGGIGATSQGNGGPGLVIAEY
jgi:hypothetical protein